MSELRGRDTEYTVRPFEDGDLDGFLELYSRVFDTDRDRAWFDWKYGDNPYVDHVPILLADRDGQIVGARPFFALDMAVDGHRELALQPADAMVHPDHRRRGLFTRMTEAAIERYTAGDPAFFFNFPNHRSAPGNLKLGWERVADQPTYYRIQDPTGMGLDGSATWTGVAGRLARPLLRAYNWISDVRFDGVDGVTVARHDSVPTSTMASIAAPRTRNGIHVWRDERFYDWRFDNPSWDYVAYVAEDGDRPVAGLVVGTETGSGPTTVKVTDVAPTPDGTASDGVTALLHRVVEEHRDADLVAAPSSLPRSTVAKAGFRSDDRPPLTNVATQTTHVARSLGDGWVVDGLDVRDATNWRFTFSEQDSS